MPVVPNGQQVFKKILVVLGLSAMAAGVVFHTANATGLESFSGDAAFVAFSLATLAAWHKSNAIDARACQWTVVTFGPVSESLGGMAVRMLRLSEALRHAGCSTQLWWVGSGPGKGELDSAHIGGVWKAAWCLLRARERGVVVISSAQFVPVAFLSRLRGHKVIWDPQAVESLAHWQSYNAYGSINIYNATAAIVWRILEVTCACICNVVFAISGQESRELVFLFPQLVGKIVTVRHQASRPADPAKKTITLPSKYVLFVGNVGAKHNLQGLTALLNDSTFTDVLKQHGVTLVLIGRQSMRMRARYRDEQVPLECYENVDGSSLTAAIRNAVCCLSPVVVATGVLTKMIDYMLNARAIVCTPQSTRGLALEKDYPIYVGALSEFGPHVESILSSQVVNPDRMALDAAEAFSFEGFQKDIVSAIKLVSEGRP